MGLRIGDVFLTLLADGAKLQPQVEAEAAKAGDAGAKTLGERLGTGLKTGAVKAFGAAATAAFAVATKGAIELENVQARIQAETGATAEEAEHMASVVNRVAGENRMALDEVAEAAIRVRRDLGATGEEADQLTADFAEFARVTRQEAAGAVSDFDDILDSWGLEAEDAADIMDKLLVSQQKFGGSITDNQKTLAALAPAMRAANMEIDDGIALLGLFGSKGLDANSASAAFAKALTKVKSPAELQRLIDDIAATEDPFKRAEKAAELFGARAGAKLANALGGVHLDDYAISMDEAAGATERAADALDSTFSARIQKAISQAQAAVREFGASFGPALTSMATLASLAHTLGLRLPVGPFKALGAKIMGLIGAGMLTNVGTGIMVDSIGDAATSAGKSSRLASMLKGAGATIGGKLASFIGVGLAAAGGVAIALAFKEIALDPKLDAQVKQLSNHLTNSMIGARLDQLATMKQAIENGIAEIRKLPFGEFLYGDEIAALEAQLDQVTQAMIRRGEEITQGVVTGIMHDRGSAEAAIQEAIVEPTVDGVEAAAAAAGEAAPKIPKAIGEGILERQGRVRTAMDRLKMLMDNVMTRMEEVAYLRGVRTSKRLEKALKDGRPAVRAQGQAVLTDWESRMTALVNRGGKAGKAAQDELEKALKSKIPEVRAAAQRVKDAVVGPMQGSVTPAGNAGERIGREFARRLTAAVRGGVNIEVQFGGNGIVARAEGGPVMAGQPYRVNERTPRSEVFVPEVDGRILSSAESVKAVAGAAGGGGSVTYNIPLTVQGALRVRDPQDVVTELRRGAELGILPARNLPSQYRREEMPA